MTSQATDNTNHAQPLQTAPEGQGPSPEAKPAHYSANFLIETQDGYHVEIIGEQLRPADLSVFIRNTSEALKKAGFRPVSREVQVNVEVGAPAAQATRAAAGGEAVKLPPSTEGGPPRCSLHGPMKWMEGTSQAKDGKPARDYAFWACTQRDCRPKEQKG